MIILYYYIYIVFACQSVENTINTAIPELHKQKFLNLALEESLNMFKLSEEQKIPVRIVKKRMKKYFII